MLKTYRVARTQRVAPDVLLLTVQAKGRRDWLRFYPGQYAAIGFKRFSRPSPMRCFSIVSSPNKLGTLQFAIRIQGDYTQSLAALEVGDTIFVRGPFGSFVIDQDHDRSVIMMAAGIGITPLISMIRYATETQLPIPLTLLYSHARGENIPFQEELREHQLKNPRLKVIYFITQGDTSTMQEKYVVRGRIDEQWLAQLTGDAYDQFTYFLCGPNRFIKAMRSTLHAHAADPARVISEEFTPASGTSEIAASSVQRAAPRWTYGLTGGSLLLAVLFFMVLDLDRAIPHAQAASTQTTAASSSTASPNQDTATTSSGSSGTDSTVNGQANSNSSTLITPQTYQTPVTSVS